MYHELEIERWPRKAAFELFRGYEDPFFNITASVDVTGLYKFCKANDLAFSLAALHASLNAANAIPEFRLRLLANKVVEFDTVHGTQTILNDDDTFSFSYFEWASDLFEFERSGRISRDKYKALKTFDVEADRLDVIYYSVIPWVSFTSFKHAVRTNADQTVPRMVFGKLYDESGRRKMPFSVEVNHALVDGLHVGKYFQRFQEKLDAPGQ